MLQGWVYQVWLNLFSSFMVLCWIVYDLIYETIIEVDCYITLGWRISSFLMRVGISYGLLSRYSILASEISYSNY